MIHTDGTPTIANAPALEGFDVRRVGDLYLVQALDKDARTWLSENVDLSEAQFFGFALVVEHRYIHDLVSGMFDAGFKVK